MITFTFTINSLVFFIILISNRYYYLFWFILIGPLGCKQNEPMRCFELIALTSHWFIALPSY